MTLDDDRLVCGRQVKRSSVLSNTPLIKLGLALALALLLAACATGSGTEAVLDDAVAGGDDDRDPMPFAVAFGWIAEDADRSAQENDDVVDALAACLADAGFPPEAVPPRDHRHHNPLAPPSSVQAALFVVLDEERAAQHGYGIIDQFDELEERAPEPDAFDLWMAQLSEAEATAFGRALGECEEGISQPERYDDDAVLVLQSRYRADPVVEAVYRDWSECMAQRGFDSFDDPAEARQSIPRDLWAPLVEMGGVSVQVGSPEDPITDEHVQEMRRSEIALATADAACQAETVVPALDELHTLQRDLLSEYAERFGP